MSVDWCALHNAPFARILRPCKPLAVHITENQFPRKAGSQCSKSHHCIPCVRLTDSTLHRLAVLKHQWP